MNYKKLKQIIEKHRTKIIVAAPIFLIAILTFFAIYVIYITTRIPIQHKNNGEVIALKAFDGTNIVAKSYVVYNSNENRIIFSKNASAQLPLASLTKIMSALVALDIAPRDTLINVRNSTGVTHSWRLDDLLGVTLVASSNDDIGAIVSTLAATYKITGGNLGFVDLMNIKAQMLSLNQTFFLNESGLDVSGELAGAYGSASDVAKLFEYAIENAPDIFGTTKFNSLNITSVDGLSQSVNNTNQTVSKIPGIIASKTGLTDLAGGNLVIEFDVDSKNRIIIVVLGSTQEARFSDVEGLSAATFDYFSKKQL